MTEELKPGFIKIKELVTAYQIGLGLNYENFRNKKMYATSIKKNGDSYEIDGLMIEAKKEYCNFFSDYSGVFGSVKKVPVMSIQRIYPKEIKAESFKEILASMAKNHLAIKKHYKDENEKIKNKYRSDEESLSFYRGLMKKIGDVNERPKDYYEEMPLW